MGLIFCQLLENTMPTIEANTDVVTQINVFTCAPENQQALIEHLIRAATFAKQISGWKSASIHKGLDGKSVVNYAQAENDEAHGRIFAELKDKGYIDRGHHYGEAHPGLYQTVFTLEK